MTERLRDALHDAVGGVPAVRLSEDPWRQGRRLRRRERWTQGLSAVVVLLVVAVAFAVTGQGGGTRITPADGSDAVPGDVSTPWMWQATVQSDPRGQASLLLTGDGWGLSGTDVFDHEGKVAVVGRDGSYRMLLYAGASQTAGHGVVLSPDGRQVASQFLPDEQPAWAVVTDLATGHSRRLVSEGRDCCAVPVAWSPDGRLLLALDHPFAPTGFDPVTGYGQVPAELVVYDLTAGTTQRLGAVGDLHQLRAASAAAFSPDSRHVVMTVGKQVKLMSLSGQTLWTADLGDRTYLAGVGAYTGDGRLITTVTLDGCLDSCTTDALAERTWRFGYLDAATGAPATGPALADAKGMAVRALGWRHGRDLVTLEYEPEPGHDRTSQQPMWQDTGYWETGHVVLTARTPDGNVETLLDPPGEVLGIDVARDLLEAGRFGGPAAQPAMFPARDIIMVPLVLLGAPLLLVLGVTGLVLWRWRRRRRARRTPATPSGPAPAP